MVAQTALQLFLFLLSWKLKCAALSHVPYSTLFWVTWPIWHTWGLYDQYRTLKESGDEYCTLFEHVESHHKHSYYTSLRIYWDDTFCGFCQCIQLGWRRKVAVFASLWWLLSLSDNPLIACFSIPSWIHPPKNCIAFKAQNGTWDAVSIDNTALS